MLNKNCNEKAWLWQQMSIIRYLDILYGERIIFNQIRKPENRKPYYLRLHHTMYHEKCEGHKFAQSLQNCT